MAGFNLSIGADTRGFSSAIKSGLINPLEDVEDVIDKVSKSGDDIGGGLEDGMRKAQRETKDAADEIDTLQDSIKRVNKAAKDFGVDGGSGISDGVRKGTDDAKEGLGEFKDEANSTAREAAASFDGSAESIGDAFQEVAANAFAGFGPAGAAAGLLIAAGLGTVFAKLEEGKEDTEEFQAKVAELGAEFIEAGGKGEASLEYVIDKLKELATTTEEGTTNLEDLQKAVEGAGNGKNFDDIAAAVAGAGANIDDLLGQQEEVLEKLQEEAQQSDQTKTGVYKDNLEKAQSQQLVVDELRKAKDAADAAAAGEAAYAAAGGAELQAKADLINNIDEAYDEAAGGATDYINAESGIFDVQAYLDSMNQRSQALVEYQETLATAALTPEAKAFISSQGVDSASTFMAGYKTATPAQQAELNRIWSEAGRTSSGAFSGSTKAELRQAGYEAFVKLNPDASAIRNYLSQVKTQDILLRVQNRIDLPARQGMGVP